MSFAVTKTYDDGTDLTEAQLDAAFGSIETLVNTTKFATENLQAGAVDDTILASASVTAAKIATGAVTLAKLASEVAVFLVPTGAVSAYGGSSAPTGWLVCDGSAVSRATYSALYGVIGTKHGSGDGSSTFNLPDYRGRFLRGFDNGAGRDPDAASRTAMNSGGNTGDNIGTVQGHELDSHTHTQNAHTHTSPGRPTVTTGGNIGWFGGTLDNPANTTVTTSSTTATNQNTGGNETRPVNAAVNFIIKI